MKQSIIIFSRVSSQKQDLNQQTQQLQNEAIRLGYPIDNQILIEQKESGISLSEEDMQDCDFEDCTKEYFKVVNS